MCIKIQWYKSTNKLQSGLQVFALLKITVYCLRLWVIIIKIIINVGVQCVLLLLDSFTALPLLLQLSCTRFLFVSLSPSHLLLPSPFELSISIPFSTLSFALFLVFSFNAYAVCLCAAVIFNEIGFLHTSRNWQANRLGVNTCRVDILLM